MEEQGQTNAHAYKPHTLVPQAPAIMLPPSLYRCQQMAWLSHKVGSRSLDVSKPDLVGCLPRVLPGVMCEGQDVGMDNLSDCFQVYAAKM